ncbi:hypothetical protein UMNF18_2497 [Escherichia coli UMNF18]|nr:hypothetical protein UMNF18_2497 [Escherichia coli UMNF18]EII45697.1 hypothetical protein EC23916_4378 [Escherichia coli 2.3916]
MFNVPLFGHKKTRPEAGFIFFAIAYKISKISNMHEIYAF